MATLVAALRVKIAVDIKMKRVKIDDKERPRDSRSSRRPATAASSSSKQKTACLKLLISDDYFAAYTRDSMGKYTGEAPLTIHG